MTTYYNEMLDGGRVREPYALLSDWVETMPDEIRQMKQAEAEALFRRIGITFAVYGEGGDPDRLIPFDMMPRVFLQSEWRKLERGIKQRARALNAFLRDVYGRGEIVRAGRIPARLVYQNEAYEKAVVGFVPPRAESMPLSGLAYFGLLAGGLVLAALPPFLFYRWRRPEWEEITPAEAEAYSAPLTRPTPPHPSTS
mgnify:CR=1 FL=1